MLGRLCIVLLRVSENMMCYRTIENRQTFFRRIQNKYFQLMGHCFDKKYSTGVREKCPLTCRACPNSEENICKDDASGSGMQGQNGAILCEVLLHCLSTGIRMRGTLIQIGVHLPRTLCVHRANCVASQDES